MLDLLPLRSAQAYDRLADALHLSGHTLLADFLREEDISKQPLNVKDMFKRLPFLSKNMKDHEKKLIESYMCEKIQGAILSHTWQWGTKEKDKALVAKQEQLEQAYQHEQQIRKKQEEVAEAQRLARQAKEEGLAAKVELRALEDNASRLQAQLKAQLDTQTKFSVANDNIASRTAQRLQTAELVLRAVQEKLQSVVKLTPRDHERDLMKKADNPFHFLPDDVDMFVAQFRKLLVVRLKYEELCDERNAVLTHLGLRPPPRTDDDEDGASLLQAYLDFTDRNDERIGGLQKEVARYGGMLEDLSKAKEQEEQRLAAAGTVWQNAIMSVMRKQLQDLKASIRKKETTLGIKDAEIGKLRSKVSELEHSLARTQDSTSVIDLHNGPPAPAPNPYLDSPEGQAAATSPKPRAANAGSTHTLPPLKSNVSHKTSSSPRPGMARSVFPHVQHVAVPRGIVVETDTPLTMYPAGLTTMQLRIQREDGGGPPGGVAGGSKGPQMGSTLGELRAMHGKYQPPPSRGGGNTSGMEAPSVSSKRKIQAKVK